MPSVTSSTGAGRFPSTGWKMPVTLMRRGTEIVVAGCCACARTITGAMGMRSNVVSAAATKRMAGLLFNDFQAAGPTAPPMVQSIGPPPLWIVADEVVPLGWDVVQPDRPRSASCDEYGHTARSEQSGRAAKGRD